MEGWIKLHRKLLNNNELFGSGLTMAIFVTLLLMADEQGKVTIGRFQLAERFRAKPSTIYQTLKRLQSNNQITLESNNKHTKVSICNFSKYQEKVTPKVTTNVDEYNTITRIENKNTSGVAPKKDKSFGTINIDDFQREYPTLDVRLEFRKADNWLKAKGKRFKDYHRFFDNWLIRAVESKRNSVEDQREDIDSVLRRAI